MAKRIVITGVGVISPLGVGLEALWQACLEGRTGIGPVRLFDAGGYYTQIGAEVQGFDAAALMDPKLAKRCDRFCQFGVVAALQALENSGLVIDEGNRERVGVLLSSGIGGMGTWEEQYTRLQELGPGRVSPFLVPMMISNILSGVVAQLTDARGPNLSVITACATSAHAIGIAADLIRLGRADVFIAGGSEAAITPTAYSGFGSARATSKRNDDPLHACRPFDRDRDGFVMGEGGAAVILEDLEHAQARGARIWGEVLGYGMSGDAFHMTAPRPDGSGAAQAIRVALEDAGIRADQVDYVNAHAPGTPDGDNMEARAIHNILGDAVPVSSTKPIHGHLLGAAGAAEMLVCVQAIREGILPHTVNCDNLEEGITIDVVQGEPRRRPVELAISNSFGFGGHNIVLVVGPPPT